MVISESISSKRISIFDYVPKSNVTEDYRGGIHRRIFTIGVHSYEQRGFYRWYTR